MLSFPFPKMSRLRVGPVNASKLHQRHCLCSQLRIWRERGQPGGEFSFTHPLVRVHGDQQSTGLNDNDGEKTNNVQIQERMISLVLGEPVKSEASDMAQ